jgi:rhodanese-related sulfurtransferase
MKSIDIQTLNKLLGAGDAPVLLDVRRSADYTANPQTIAGARWCDPENIDRWVKDLPSDRPIVLYCVKGGPVSQSAVDRLRREGLDAAWVEGGLKAWVEGGHPVQAVLPKRK